MQNQSPVNYTNKKSFLAYPLLNLSYLSHFALIVFCEYRLRPLTPLILSRDFGQSLTGPTTTTAGITSLIALALLLA